MHPTLVWFRSDLRLADNPALLAAVSAGGPVIPVFIWAPEEEEPWPPGAASRWWLHQSLASLGEALARLGSRLILRKGSSLRELRKLAAQTGAGAVCWNRRYEPAAVLRDAAVKAALEVSGLRASEFSASLLFDPGELRTKSGKPFQVFTPFWRACNALGEPAKPVPTPAAVAAPKLWPASAAAGDLNLEPKKGWAEGIAKVWKPGEEHARGRLQSFAQDQVKGYPVERDRPAQTGTSRLSPYLHFGEISPKQIWHAMGGAANRDGSGAFLREVGWREFAHHLLVHFPRTTARPLRGEFEAFPWRTDQKLLRAWQKGQTGYPIVDAGMRELWRTGWMHNRVRMVAASFLVKHLLIGWDEGARWFWDTLVDADLANNTFGWQWTAGCGADAAPFFRIFNPVLQGEKFDAAGKYVRRWVPELSRVPDRWIHKPWEAPASVLSAAGVRVGSTYPAPVVDHEEARHRALAAFAQLRSGSEARKLVTQFD